MVSLIYNTIKEKQCISGKYFSSLKNAEFIPVETFHLFPLSAVIVLSLKEAHSPLVQFIHERVFFPAALSRQIPAGLIYISRVQVHSDNILFV